MAKTPQQFSEELKKIHPTIEIIGVYTKAVEPIKVRCTCCGKEWQPKAYSLLSGKGCPHCSSIKGARNNKGKTGLKSQETFVKQMREIHPDIEVRSAYINTHSNVDCLCLVCGKEWFAKPYSLLQGHGCPRCVKSGTSFMEQLIYHAFCDALGEENVFSRDRSTIGMELDIVVPKYKIAVEPGNWLLHKKYLERDRKKRILCLEKGYRLITIYDKYPNEKKPPFSEDCYVYKDDLNKIDHSEIHKLISLILESFGRKETVDKLDWDRLEILAYDSARAKTHEDFVFELKKLMPTIEVLGTYTNSNRRIKARCKKCGFIWDAVPANIIRGDGCRKCGTKEAHRKFVREQKDYESELSLVNPNIEIIGNYVGRHKTIKARCKICGFEWEPVAGSLLRGSSHRGSKHMHKRENRIN